MYMFFCTCEDPEIFSVGGERVPYFRQIWILGVGGGIWNPLLYPPPLDPSMIYLHMKGFFVHFLLLLFKVDMDDYRIHIHIWLTQSWVIFVMLFSIYLWRVFWQPSFVYRQQLLQALSLSSQWQMMHLFLQTFLNDTQNFLFRVLYGGNSAIIWTEGSKL